MHQKIIYISLLLSIVSISYANTLFEKGYFVKLEYISDEYYLNESLSPARIAEYIHEVNPGRDETSLTNIELAQLIDHISYCYEIDPYIFTGLIRQESGFNENAISSTGAFGLTQMTGIGIKEVNDQLGYRGPSYAKSTVIKFHNTTAKDCTENDWINMWSDGVNMESISAQKNWLKEDPLRQVIYGAILLKTYLAYSADRYSNLDLKDIYIKTLLLYNNDPNEGDKFWKKIFNHAKAIGLEI